jgi:drug/metabolite transporter (DMT)-like permease
MAGLTIARGSSFLLSKHLLGCMEPLNLLGVRFILAFLILFVFFWRRVLTAVKQDPGIIRASLILGGVYFVCMASELVGLQFTTASTCSFLENSAIVMVPVLEAILLKHLPKPVIIVSTLITFIGIGLIVLRGSGNAAESVSAQAAGPGIGEALCMVAALTYAIAIIITDRISKQYDTISLGILYVGFMGLLGLAASFLVETPRLPAGGIDWIFLIMLALLCTAFGFAMQPVAQKPLSSETTGIICALNPLTTAILGRLLMGDAMGISGICGTVLILAGIVMPNLRLNR